MSRMTKVLALAGVVLSAAGCMTVPGAHPGTPRPAPSPHRSPDPADAQGPADEDAPPRPAQGPVKEALSQLPGSGERLAGGASRPQRAAPVGARNDPPMARAHPQQPPRAPHTGRPAPPGQPPAGEGGGGEPERSSGALRAPAPRHAGSGICELGEAYGRWDPGSEQARICRAAYGG